jgi:hypothetical protein
MKRLIPYMFLLGLILNSCQLDNLHPNRNKHKTANSNSSDTLNKQDPIGHGSVVGIWKWSAQYSYGYPHVYLLDPSNTGIQETLNLDSNSNWAQVQNDKIVNTGTYKLVNVFTPAGPNVFISFVNSSVTDTARYDNFNFSTGFIGSYAASKDSLIFYGVYTMGNYTNLVSERVYVK